MKKYIGTPSAIVPSSDLVATASAITPKATPQVVRDLAQSGMRPREIIRSATLVKRFGTNFHSIRRWYVDEQMDLDRVEHCLQLRQDYAGESFHQISVVAINKLLEEVAFQTVAFEDVISVFLEVMGRMQSNIPMNALLKRMDEAFDGDYLRAYNLAAEDPDGFILIIRKQVDRIQLASTVEFGNE